MNPFKLIPHPQKYIFILGGGLMQERLIQECISLHYSPVVLDKNPNPIAKNYPCHILQADISDPTDCLNVCIAFAEKIGFSPSGAITVGTDFPLSVSAICQSFNLPRVPHIAAKNTSNKILMRTVLQKNNISQPLFTPIYKIQNLQKSIDSMQFPLVIKPADSMGARGVCKIHSPAELTSAYLQAAKFSKSHQVLAESLVVGPEFSLDALIFNDTVHITGFADRIITHDPYFVEIGHNIPSNAPLEIQKKVQEIFIQATRALGISYGFAKGDIFWDIHKKQPVVGEIASRLSGGFMSSYTYPLSSGINLMKNALFLILGQTNDINLQSTKNWITLERAIIAENPGKISYILHLQETLDINGVSHIFFHKKQGDFVAPPRNNVEKIANILVSSPDYESAEKTMQTALQTLQIIVE